MKGKFYNKNGELVVIYKHYDYINEKRSWKTSFIKIKDVEKDMWNYIGFDIVFQKTVMGAEIDLQSIKKIVRDIKINKIIDEEKRNENIGTIV